MIQEELEPNAESKYIHFKTNPIFPRNLFLQISRKRGVFELRLETEGEKGRKRANDRNPQVTRC